MSRIVCWRAGASRAPPRSSCNRSAICASSASGERTVIRAAASSIARGSPSRWRHSAATVSALASSSRNAGRTARARSAKSRTAAFSATAASEETSGGGTGRGSTGSWCSSRSLSAARLVARTCTAGQAARRPATRSADRGREVLAVVEQQQRLPGAQVSRQFCRNEAVQVKGRTRAPRPAWRARVRDP